jgi:spore germination protein YaaH
MARKNELPQQSNNAGCWLMAIISIFVAMMLVIVALFLPPFNLYSVLTGDQYTVLSAQGEALPSVDGNFTLAAASDVNSEFGARIEVTSLQNFEAGNGSVGEWIPAASNAVPYYLALQSAVYSIKTIGTVPPAVLLSIRINVGSPDLLDLYGWYENETGGGEWRFIPSTAVDNRLETVTEQLPDRVAAFQAAPDVPKVIVTYDVSTALSDDVATVASIIAPGGLQPSPNGTIIGSLAAGSSSSGAYRWMPIIRNFNDPRAVDAGTVSNIINNPTLRSNHVRELTLLTNSNGFDGIIIDYRGLPAEQRDNFSAFIRELNANLSGIGRSLAVVVAAAENIGGFWETGAYDWRSLGAEVDYFQIRLGINPQLYTPGENQFVEAMLRWTVGEVDRYKVVLDLTTLSVRDIAGSYSSIAYDEALAGLGNVQIEADSFSETGTIQPGSTIRASLDGRHAIGGMDTILNMPFLDYVDKDNNVTARIWITTGNALRFRMNWTERFALGGVAFGDLLEEGVAHGVLRAIGEYSTQIPTAATTAEWSLHWRIVGSDGSTVQEYTTGLNEDLDIILEAPDGNYAINPSVVLLESGIEQESIRTGAQVALFQATLTPTPLPTSTPTPLPTLTPTPPPVLATNAPVVNDAGQVINQSSGNTGTNPLAGGRINLSGFAYGGHVTSTGSSVAINAMQQAGMTWMKVQVRYQGPGSDPGGAIAAVQQGHAAGFRVLIGTVGSPAGLGAGGEGYMQAYGQWLAAIAAGGADAIEVWNEPNLSREWPEGQINGASYANMLRIAYNAIKSANGSTIVISGAPAPTGAEAAFPGQVMNDDNFLRQMVNAGGLSYVDCIGVHYNEGIVPPTTTSGDPRGDNYYTRYLPSMVQVYRGITGGKPMCFTELGYLTPEGYPPLPSFFSWASDNTLAEQSAWLAQAAAYLSQQGDVRLMIVWNVDFTAYAGDPQGGYAMVRPGGGCPACVALSQAR